MKRGLLLGLIAVAGVLPSSASGQTVVAPGSDRYDYSRWIERSQAMTPLAEVRVREEPCGGAVGCAVTTQKLIYVDPSLPWFDARVVFMHEVGHIYDEYGLEPEQRQRLAALMETRLWRPPGASGEDRPTQELFADLYSQCSIDRWHRAVSPLSRAPVLAPGRMAVACALLSRR